MVRWSHTFLFLQIVALLLALASLVAAPFSLFLFFYFTLAIEMPCIVDVGTEPDVGKGNPQEARQLLLPAIMEGHVQVVPIHLFLE